MTTYENDKLYEDILREISGIIKRHLNEAAVEIKFPEFDKKEFIKEFGLWVKSFKMKTLPDEPVKPQMRQKPEVIDKPRKPTETLAKEPEQPAVLKTISDKEEFLKHMSELYGGYFKRFIDYRQNMNLGLGSSWWDGLRGTDDPQKIYSICNDAYQIIRNNIDNVTSSKERNMILETLGKYVSILRLIVEDPEKSHSILSKKALHRDEKIINKYNEKMREYQERIKKYGKPYSDDYLRKKAEYDAAIEEYNKKVEAASEEYADTSGFATESAYERAMEKYELALDKWEDAKMKYGPDRKINITDYLLIRYIYGETGEEVIHTKFGRYKVPKWVRGLKTSQMEFQDKSFEHRSSYTKFLEMNPKISIMTPNGLRANSRTGWTLKKFITSWVINYYMAE